MSLGARATKGGAKSAGKDTKHAQDKGKTDKPAPKEKVKPQATTEQIRMANMIDRKSDDASDVRRMVLELMEMTRRSEEEVCSALHDCDNDLDSACNLLLEESQRIQGEWQTSEKKKKKPPAPTNNGETSPVRERERERERSLELSRSRNSRSRSGRVVGSERGRGSARGRGRAARGARGGRRGRLTRGGWSQGAGGNMGDSFPATEDWDNEEWSGSLSDTKVFTPSAPQTALCDEPPTEDWDEPSANGTADTAAQPYYAHTQPAYNIIENSRAELPPAAPPAAPAAPDDDYHHHQVQPMGMSGSLSAAQSQYLSQLTQQSRHAAASTYAPTSTATPASTTAAYGVGVGVGVYGGGDVQRHPRHQRARVPPPSKIPVSAVEMPGGEGGAMFLDVQFGALDPDTMTDTAALPASQPEPQPVAVAHETTTETPNSTYPNSMLSEPLSVVESTPSSQPVATESIVTNSTTSLEKQLSASMKQLSTEPAPPQPHHYHHHRPKPQPPAAVSAVSSAPSYPPPPAPQHLPPVYPSNVYAPQVNSTNAGLTGASAMAAAYPSSVTLTQYQPIINSYQQTSSSATVYGGSALYTAAPYTAYQPTQQPAKPAKDTPQYDSSVASSNSLTSTSTAQTTTAKVATTTVSGAGGAGGAGNAAYAGALYGGAATYGYDDQIMRTSLPHHMTGYYEVGYGVGVGGVGSVGGVGGAREPFGVTPPERFGRADAASPQQVPAALPPGYAYFYQPPPTTYPTYGVYPTYGGGSNVGGVGGVSAAAGGKLNTYAPQQPPYDQDSYKAAGGGYSGAGSKAAAAAADLGGAMYAKAHVQLNKVNSYEKATFHSGTPPPFGAGSHLYIPHHHHSAPHHHAPQQHQMDARVNSSHNRRESGAGGGRATSKQQPAKPAYSQSYWAPN